jgi:hypothetical protein
VFKDTEELLKILRFEIGAVAHSYNPSYSEGRDEKYHCSRPTQARRYPKNT